MAQFAQKHNELQRKLLLMFSLNKKKNNQQRNEGQELNLGLRYKHLLRKKLA